MEDNKKVWIYRLKDNLKIGTRGFIKDQTFYIVKIETTWEPMVYVIAKARRGSTAKHSKVYKMPISMASPLFNFVIESNPYNQVYINTMIQTAKENKTIYVCVNYKKRRIIKII